MSRKRIAVYGGSFNPPGLHHVEVARTLTRMFDRVIVVPCGPRPDKTITNDIAPSHRATMADLAFAGIPGAEVDLFDLENDVFTTNDLFEDRYGRLGDVYHVVGSDLVGPKGRCSIRDCWKDGERLWRRSRFAVLTRKGYRVEPDGLPDRHELIEMDRMSGSSTEIRRHITEREPFEHLVPEKVAGYIKRYGLYRISVPSESSHIRLERPKLHIVRHGRNSRAFELSERFLHASSDPDLIAVFGGDGFMLRAIKDEWRRRVPFYGVNAGHRGFLLNEWRGEPFGDAPKELILYRAPLLDVEMTFPDGRTHRALAFNDAHVRNVDQAAWVRISVDGTVRTEKMVADAVLVSTPAGSTAYAFAMGATPMLLDHKGLVLAASAVNEPFGWRPVHLPESVVTFEALDPKKRPIEGKVDGGSFGPVLRMTVRVSRIASAELAFDSDAGLEEKRIAMQFPGR